MTAANFFENIPEVLPEELFQQVLNRSNVKIERIVSRGHRSPENFWYDQDWDEWVLVLRGRAAVQIQGQPAATVLEPGDHLFLAAHIRHRVAWTDDHNDTIWLAVHIQSGQDL